MEKLTLALVAFLLLLAPCPTLAQGGDEEASFAAKPMQEGQPALPSGQQVRLDIDNPRYAAIPAGDLLPSLFFMVHGSDNGRATYSLVFGRSGGGFSYQTVSLERNENGEAQGTADVSINDTTAVPIELRFLPENSLLLYRWPDSPDSLSSAGGQPGAPQSTSLIRTGRTMPSFIVETLEGEQVSLEGLRGKNVVINWWATSCAPCVVEMPGLNELVRQYDDRSDIVFLAVAWNTKEELERFFTVHNFAYRQAIKNERIAEIFGAAFPRNVIVDAQGEVVYDKLGGAENQHEEIEAALQEHVLDRE